MASVNMPNVRTPDDALTTIIKGLQVANGVYGIASDIDKLDEYQRKVKHEDDLAKGSYSRDEQLKLRDKFDISNTAPSEPYQQAYDTQSGDPFYLSLKKDNTPLMTTINNMKRGNEIGTGLVNQRLLIQGKTPDEAMVGFYPTKPPNDGITPYQKFSIDSRNRDYQDNEVEKAGKANQPYLSIMDGFKRLEDATGLDNFKLENYDPKKSTYYNPKTGYKEKVDLPGFGVLGTGYRSYALTEQGRLAKAAMAEILNTKIYDVSGKAITNAEMERIQTQFGQGVFSSEEEIYGAMKQYKQATIQAMKATEARFPKPIIQEYKKRGGFTSDQFDQPKQKEIKQPKYKEGDIHQLGDTKYKLTNGQWIEVQ